MDKISSSSTQFPVSTREAKKLASGEETSQGKKSDSFKKAKQNKLSDLIRKVRDFKAEQNKNRRSSGGKGSSGK